MKKSEEKAGILLFLFFWPYYFYKKNKIKKINSELKTLKSYDFSETEKTELKKIITEKYKKDIDRATIDIVKIENENPLILEQIEKGKKEHEELVIKEHEKISGFKEKVSELKERIKLEIGNAGELLKRRPYLDSRLQRT